MFEAPDVMNILKTKMRDAFVVTEKKQRYEIALATTNPQVMSELFTELEQKLPPKDIQNIVVSVATMEHIYKM